MAGQNTGVVENVDNRRIVVVVSVEDKPIADMAIRIATIAFEASRMAMMMDSRHRVDSVKDAIVRCKQGNQVEVAMQEAVEDKMTIVGEQTGRR
jgi:hypothetical protein